MNIDITVNEAFREYLGNWEYKDYIVFGGYGSSKSYHTALKLVLKALQEKRRILVVRAVARTLQESCYSLIKEVIAVNNLDNLFKCYKSPLKIIAVNGSEFIFMGLDDPAKLKSINAIDVIWIEETAEISYDAFKELKGRLRSLKKTHMLLTFNPVSKKSWVYDFYFKKMGIDENLIYNQKNYINDGTMYHHSVVTDNKFVSNDYVNTLKDLKKHDEELYRIAFLGHFGFVGEKVFNNYEVIPTDTISKAVEELSRFGMGNLFDGLDLGFSISFNALVRCAIDRVNNYLYIYSEEYHKGLINSEVVELVKNGLGKRYNRLIVDSSRPELIEELCRNGIRAYSSKKGKGSVIEGLQKIKSFKKVFISENCKKVIDDFTEFSHKKDKNGEFIEDQFNIDSHTIDAIKYAIEEYRPNRLKGGEYGVKENTRSI